MRNPYRKFISDFALLLKKGERLPSGFPAPVRKIDVSPNAPKVLIFSPHPDDECVSGALPLRLLRELRMKVINVAVTQGSQKDRQKDRFAELENACSYLGFELVQTAENGLEKINLTTRERNYQRWKDAVRVILKILAEHQPRVIIFPHGNDWNRTHIGTHFLVRDALKKMKTTFSCYIAETEYWGTMDTPNLMVESSEEDVADLITALSFHKGEIERNPYHLRLPSWMVDNVRRGSELVGGQGAKALSFNFATIYRLWRWSDLRIESFFESGKVVSQTESLEDLFQ
jgi:LmbE family N-acetylglucosaminyl deacetylase